MNSEMHQSIRSVPGQVSTPPDRRQNVRYLTLFRVGVLETTLGTELCLIKNISSGGLRAQICSEPEIGGRAAVELKTGHKAVGTIIWAANEHFGLQFDEPIDVEDLLANAAMAANGLRSRLPRIDVRCFVTLRSGARIYRGTSVDISQGGAKIELDRKLDLGQVVVSLPGLEAMHGQVRWSDGRHTGIAFNQLIPFRRLVRWTKEEPFRQEHRPEIPMAEALLTRHA